VTANFKCSILEFPTGNSKILDTYLNILKQYDYRTTTFLVNTSNVAVTYWIFILEYEKYCTEICYWSNKIRNTEEMEGSRKDILCISLIYVRISARPPCICMISIICSPQMCLLVSAHNKIIYCIIKNKKRDGNTNARNHFCWGIYVSLLMFLFNLHLPAAP